MIEVETVEGIAVLRMQHGKANALDIEFCEALAARFNALRTNDEVEAIVLTGAGTMFSAGVDLKRLSAGGAHYVRAFLPALHKLYEEVFFHPKPVVAAINGHAVAGGAILACCADRRIMAHEAGRIGVTEMLVGVPFPALAFEVLRAAVPAEYLAEFAYSGATYMTDDALECGWIDGSPSRRNCLRTRLPWRRNWRPCRRRPSRSPRRRSADPSPNVSPSAARRSTARSRRCGAPTIRWRACAITWRGC